MAVELPDAPPAPTPSATDAALATIQTFMDKKAQDEIKAQTDLYDIKDPGQPKQVLPIAAPVVPPEPPQTIPGATATPVIPDHLVNEAVTLGFTTDQAKALGEDGLRRVLSLQATQPPIQTNEPPPAKVEDEYPTLDDAKAEPVTDPVTGEAVPGRYDAHLKETIAKQNALLKKQSEELAIIKARQDEAQQRATAQRSARDFQAIEKVFQSDTDFKDVFGEGPAEALRGTPQFNNRARVAQLADTFVNSGAASNIKEGVELAKYRLFRDKVLASVSNKTTNEIAERARNAQGQFLAKPQAVPEASDLPPGDAKALRTIERFMSSRAS